jgi:Branched-chain amino acid transport protein (AzlD)
MSGLGEGLWSYFFLFVAGFCATQPWRYLGVILSRGVHEDAEILVWVRAVSTALVAGLVARMVFLPAGALATVTMDVRLGAFLFGCSVFFLAKKSLAAGVVSGAAALMLIQSFLAG